MKKLCICFLLICAACSSVSVGIAGDKYTGMYGVGGWKNRKMGKPVQSIICFTFHNTTDSVVDGITATFNLKDMSWIDCGGFPHCGDGAISGRSVYAYGMDILPGDSVTMFLLSPKPSPVCIARTWHWLKDTARIGEINLNLPQKSYSKIYGQPWGGNILDYLYEHVVPQPAGVVCGIENSPFGRWVRFTKPFKRYFYHSGAPRCLDSTGMEFKRPVTKEVRNPLVKKHNNLLLEGVHILRLTIIANDSGFTEPLNPGATLFGDLLYQDSVNSGDPCNGRTIRQIAHLADSALSYCGNFSEGYIDSLQWCINRINLDFSGGGIFEALSFSPLVLKGMTDLDARYYLHANPSVASFPRTARRPDAALPLLTSLDQNYPDPFNPTTTISFELSDEALVSLKVYNLLGQEVAVLMDHEDVGAGTNQTEFDAHGLPSGIYFYRLLVERMRPEDGSPSGQSPFVQIRKMVLMK